jgi:predicted ester cyclase
VSEANKQVVARLLEEGVQRGDVAVVDETFAEEPAYQGPPPDGRRGREGYRDFITQLHAALEGVTCEVERMIAEDDRVAVRARVSGRSVGEWETMAPSGRPVSFTLVAIAELDGGRIVRYVDARDNLSIWVQLGDVPAHLRRYTDGVQS